MVEIVVEASQLAGSYPHSFFERLFVVSFRGDKRLITQGAFDRNHYLRQIEWLGDVIECSVAHGFNSALDIRHPGDHYHNRFGIRLLNKLAQLDSGRAGHGDVGDYEVE